MIFTIWLTAVTIQVVITILLASQFLKYKETKQESEVSFSIVVAARNEYENLQQLIPRLLCQNHPNFEVIVALDRCSDQSEEFLEEFSQKKIKFLSINSVPQDHDPKKYALSSAIDVALGEWIVFTDADCVPYSDYWLQQINSKIQRTTKIIVGYSPYKNLGTFLHHFIQFESFLIAFNYLSMTILGKPYMGVGRNMAIKKTFFHETGGYQDFKSTIGGDDDLFIQKNSTSENTAIVVGREALIYSAPKDSWKEYSIQKTRHLSVGSFYSPLNKFLHLIFNGSLFIIWSFVPLLRFEIILPIILFYLSIKVIGYRFAHSKMGVGFNYIWLPLVDFLYAIFLPIIAIRSKLVKDIRWKN